MLASWKSALLLVAVLEWSSLAEAQSGDSVADKAGARLGVAAKEFAIAAAVCDSVEPGTFKKSIRLLKDKLGPLWPPMSSLALSLPEEPEVKQKIADYKSWVASGRVEVIDIKGGCHDALENAATKLGYAIDAANFVAE